MSDIQYALRTFRRNPMFAATVVLTFALGIGATTAIFTVLYGVLLKPLPYPNPDGIVFVATGTVTRFEEMKAAAQSYTALGAFLDQAGNVTLSGGGEPEVLRLASVSANFSSILGVDPLIGRSFLPQEELPGGPAVAMISANLWRRRFAGSLSIPGKTATLFGAPFTIIGVLPDGFQFPFPDADVWITNPTRGITPASPILSVFGRLKDGIDVEQASAELGVLTRQYAQAHPGMLDAKPNTVPRVTLLEDRVVANVRATLWMLFGAVAFVLLIACANVANLLLARSHSRWREFAVRAAIGAGRRRIMGQLLVESLLLALAGGALGLFIGNLSLSAITQRTAFDLPRVSEIQLDGMVLAFAAAVSLVTGLLFGLLPSLSVSYSGLYAALKSKADGRNSRASVTRSLLVAAQVALSIILLIGAALLMQTMLRLYRVDLQFNPENVLTVQMSLSTIRYDSEQKRVAFVDELLPRIESAPGVQSAGLAWTLPFMGYPGTPVQPASGPVLPLNERLIAALNSVNAGYFQALQIPLKRGRLFANRDNLASTPVAIANETLARQFWPAYPQGEDPVGQRILIGANPKPFEIVGIVGDVVLAPGTEIRPAVYRPYRQNPVPVLALALRVSGRPMQFSDGVRTQVRAVDPEQAITSVRTLEDLLETSLGRRQLVLTLLEFFAGVALLLAMIGVYGVMTQTVTQRTREVAVRIALGARSNDVVWAVVQQTLMITLAGIAIGIAGAFGLTRFLESYLFQVSPTEATTFIAVPVAFVIVAAAAAYLPLRRATRIDPFAVLRHD
jgi:predicted permease